MIILSPAGLGGACCTRAAVSCQTFQLPGFELWGRITCKVCFFLFPQYSTRQPLWAVGFAFPGYCCYCSCALQIIFFWSFSLLAFSAACWMSAALLSQLLSVQPTCSLPCPSALLLLLINYSSANLSVCSASTPAPLWVRSSLSFLYSLPLSPKIPHFLTS